MHAKILLFVIILLLGGFFYLHTVNPTEATLVISENYKFTLPVAVLVFAGFAVGAGLGVVNSALTGAWRGIQEMKAKRAAKRVAQADRDFSTGMEAWVEGDLDKAAAQMEKALGVKENDTYVLLTLSEVYVEAARPLDAVRVLEKASAAKPSTAVRLAMADACAEAGDTYRAARVLEEILKNESKNVQALVKLRDLKASRASWEKAVGYQRRVVDLEKDKARKGREKARLAGFLYEAARAASDAGEGGRAREFLKEVFKASDSFSPAYVLSGEITYREGNTLEAIRTWEKAVERYPGSVPLLLRLEQAYRKENAPENMIKRYEKSMGLYPDNTDIKLLAARLYLAAGDPEKARGVLQEAAASGEKGPVQKTLMGLALVKLGEDERAAAAFKEAMGLGEEREPSFNFACTECGYSGPEWTGRCPSCGWWDTLVMSGSESREIVVTGGENR